MNKSITMLLAFALVVGLNQCKKKIETIQSVPSGVYITLEVDGGDKVIVDPYHNPTYASVTFEQGDVIYVGNNGKYCGELIYNGTKKCFEGPIYPTSADDEDFLYFYFLGNKNPGNLPLEATNCTVDISDQTQELPVLSYGRSTNLYSSTNQNYSATLYNKCALVEFNLTNGTDEDVVVGGGLLTAVAVNFADPNNAISASSIVNTIGEIKLWPDASDNAKRWAIMLPQNRIPIPTVNIKGYTSAIESIPQITANMFIHGNSAIQISNTLSNGYVDFGLPSGKLWATCNVGANSPENFGYYFAWGEIETKSDYSWATYKHCMGSSTTFTKYCSNASNGYNGFTDGKMVLELEDDAAVEHWGAGWYTPTKEDWDELLANCYFQFLPVNGIYCIRFVSNNNGAEFFLPISGGINEDGPYGSASLALYWMSSRSGGDIYANCFYCDRNNMFTELPCDRFVGLPIRAVRSAQ